MDRLEERRHLLTTFDSMRRIADNTRSIEALDSFHQRAFDLVVGAEGRKAFDISQESSELRDRYGRHTWGQSVLLARRLVEAGSTFVTVHFGGWDHHWDLKKGYENYLPMVDSAVSALFEDLEQRVDCATKCWWCLWRVQQTHQDERRR